MHECVYDTAEVPVELLSACFLSVAIGRQTACLWVFEGLGAMCDPDLCCQHVRRYRGPAMRSGVCTSRLKYGKPKEEVVRGIVLESLKTSQSISSV